MIMLLYLLLTPLLVMALAKRWRWIEKVTPMTVLYGIGLLVANCLPLTEQQTAIDQTVSNLAVPIAIPLMLMGCNLQRWSTRQALKSFFSGLLAVAIVVVAGYFLFRGDSHSETFAQVCAVAAGFYTGGIPNGAPIKQGIGMSDELYIYVSSYDLIVTGLYLVFIIFCGKQVFRRLLGTPQNLSLTATSPTAIESKEHHSKASLRSCFLPHISKAQTKTTVGVLLLALLIAGLSYGLTLLLSGGALNMTLLILSLTTISIGASFLKPVQRQEQSFNLGLYFVYVFCLSIATACNVREMDLMGSLHILYYLFFVIFGSLLLQILFAKVMKIDGDTVMVSSVALINSPPFVPMAAALLGNKDVVILGISIGLLGYMLGNYLGIITYHLLLAL